MREALPELGVQARIGVDTGEVVTGTKERLATGDTVNVAARLEQAAAPGRDPDRRGDDAAHPRIGHAEPVEFPRSSSKESQSRHPAPRPAAGGRRSGAPERRSARGPRARVAGAARAPSPAPSATARASSSPVLGPAGVGSYGSCTSSSSGLEAQVVRGRCLSYGEGIMYWPVTEVLCSSRNEAVGRNAA